MEIFRVIAASENAIENLRLKLASQKDFQPRKFFDMLDEEKNRKITFDELQQFMFDSGIKGITEAIVKDIVSEYDSDGDKSLSYDEILALFLPSTNEGLRNYCLYNSRKSKGETDIPVEVKSLAA